jgi:hypothetical protein
VRFVGSATLAPHRCAVVPFVGNSTAKQGFIDTGSELGREGERVYISVAEAAPVIAQAIGWSPPSKVRKLEGELAALKAENEQLKAEVKEADKFAEAAEYTLGRFGHKVQKKPGRPKKETANA